MTQMKIKPVVVRLKHKLPGMARLWMNPVSSHAAGSHPLLIEGCFAAVSVFRHSANPWNDFRIFLMPITGSGEKQVRHRLDDLNDA